MRQRRHAAGTQDERPHVSADHEGSRVGVEPEPPELVAGLQDQRQRPRWGELGPQLGQHMRILIRKGAVVGHVRQYGAT